MNILWDMRLYSYGYRNRGVGAYCTRVATALLPYLQSDRIFLWGDRDQLPESLCKEMVTVIPYSNGSWKRSIFTLPLIAAQYHIDLVHYWVTLGPLHPVGICPFPLAPAIATVHDLGVDTWNTPFGNAVRRTMYWKAQNLFFNMLDTVICNSIATRNSIRSVLKSSASVAVVYPPLPDTTTGKYQTNRLPFFITLGGSPHKNLARTVTAFEKFRTAFPQYSLKILGEVNFTEERLLKLPEGVDYEPHMDNYYTYLRSCSGLLSLSSHEGLDIPPTEALSCSCPLLLSSIPPHYETCKDAALFTDPKNIDAISDSLATLANKNVAFVHLSKNGAETYQKHALGSIKNCLKLYRLFTPVKCIQEPAL